VVAVTIIGPLHSRVLEGLLDTGSDETVFPERYAAAIGVDLISAPAVRISGVSLAGVLMQQAEVTLRLTDGVEQFEWQAWVGFARGLNRPLLGFAGFLQFFTATFHGDREQVELAANSFYRGT
jgi:hypothetical protein